MVIVSNIPLNKTIMLIISKIDQISEKNEYLNYLFEILTVSSFDHISNYFKLFYRTFGRSIKLYMD